MNTKEARARLKTFGNPYPPCDLPGCTETAGAMVELGDPCQGEAYCTLHFRRWLDNRYAAIGRPVTAAERERRQRDGVAA